MKKLILAHGILGFSEINLLGISRLNYFRDIAAAINPKVLSVFAPAVNPLATIELRAKSLLDSIRLEEDDEIYIIAHSMGGLDARKALHDHAHFRSKVKALVTIGTPHQGSEVADAVVANNTRILRKILPPKMQGVIDLTKPACKEFNSEVNEDNYEAEIDYYTIAGIASLADGSMSLGFALTARVGGIAGVPNDGVVTAESATQLLSNKWKNLPSWSVDHAGQIGWFQFNSQEKTARHINRYIDLIAKITGLAPELVRAP